MDAITKQVNNPEWWFTVVIVGLIVGVIAAYAKDWLGSILSSLSARFRTYAERRYMARAAEVQRLTANPQLLVIEYIQCMFVLAGTIALLGASYIFTLWNVLTIHFPDFDPAHLFSISQLRTLSGQSVSIARLNFYVQLAFGIPGFALWYHFLSRYMLCQKARKLLRSQ